MRKILLFTLLFTALILSSCKDNNGINTDNNASVVQNAEYSPEQPEKPAITESGKRITITTLSAWDKFNHDGNFTDNCKNFLRMFIEGYSEFAEFETVEISDWEIIRDEDVYGNDLAFNFTVKSSMLPTLPVGTYKTTVHDAVDCYITFSGTAPNTFSKELENPSSAAKAVSTWINSYYSWYMPSYGTASKALPCVNYIIDMYGNNGMITLADFKALLNEKLGISQADDSVDDYIITTEGIEYIKRVPIGGNTEYAVTGEKESEDYTTVTVQYFADCNRFILSDTVEYYITSDEKLLGCNVISYGDYKPYGVRAQQY